jgi:transcriptional regulator of met regulon
MDQSRFYKRLENTIVVTIPGCVRVLVLNVDELVVAEVDNVRAAIFIDNLCSSFLHIFSNLNL